MACQNYAAIGGGLPRACEETRKRYPHGVVENQEQGWIESTKVIVKEMAGEVSPEKSSSKCVITSWVTRRTDMFPCSSTSKKNTTIRVCSVKTTPTLLLCKAVISRDSPLPFPVTVPPSLNEVSLMWCQRSEPLDHGRQNLILSLTFQTSTRPKGAHTKSLRDRLASNPKIQNTVH